MLCLEETRLDLKTRLEDFFELQMPEGLQAPIFCCLGASHKI